MHDPTTTAHQIKIFSYRLLTIWHKDPERRRGRICHRSDDTCGWFSPNPTESEYEAVRKLARGQYSQIFKRQVREAEGASYAYVCNVPTVLEAVYWSWRAVSRFKKYSAKRVMWQYGHELPLSELNHIISLASNPVDNLKVKFSSIKNEDDFVSFFMCVYNAYMRHHRPWYRHPSWHVHHWSFQFHPWQDLKRRFWDKCCKCNKRGFKKEHGGACGNWSGTALWHSSCEGVSHAQACQTAQVQKEAA